MHKGRWKRCEIVAMQEEVLQVVLAEVAQGRWQALDTVISDIQGVQRGQILAEYVRYFIQSVVGDAELLEEFEVTDLGD